jgi:16S rRNA G966 N2-methylase RsmD
MHLNEQSKLGLRPSHGGEVCLGITFPDAEAHFSRRLREFLTDPEFRQQSGFPLATDDEIIRRSDPPYYTACPNPFIGELVASLEEPDDAHTYSREPLAIDVSVGKTDSLYRAHGYHTKVPHQAIVPSILHYTNPGDVVLDGFCGSGMTGLASVFCETPPKTYKADLEQHAKSLGAEPPRWGKRYTILNDLSPAATFIASNYCIPVDLEEFGRRGREILDDIDKSCGWMYETLHSDGKTIGVIEYTVWSQLYSCPECSDEIDFNTDAFDSATMAVKEQFSCPSCNAGLTKRALVPQLETTLDQVIGGTRRVPKRRPSLISYKVGKDRYTKSPDARDIEIINRVDGSDPYALLPIVQFEFEKMWEAPRLREKGVSHVHNMFLPRAAAALGYLWQRANQEEDGRLRNMLVYFVEQAIVGMSILARYAPTHFSQVNQHLSGVYYVGSQIIDPNPRYILNGKLDRLLKAFSTFTAAEGSVWTGTGSSTRINVPDDSVDYIFTDPPFGDNIPYSELNLLVEAFLGVITNAKDEAVVDRSKENKAHQKGIEEYHGLLLSIMSEYFRVLRPGRWLTVVFSNTSASVWNSISSAIQGAGFVISNVSTLDKKQLGFKAITTATAVKQDLVISAYKPNGGLEDRYKARGPSAESAWDFARTHLKNLPISKSKNGSLEDVPERDPRRIYDRMVAWFVQHGAPVPLSSTEFHEGAYQRFPERDGMIFLPNQVDEYDKRRLQASNPPQRDLFVHDERSAIDWLSDFLKAKPSTYQEIHPEFTQKTGAGWRKHELKPELLRLLDENFLKFDGEGPVPSQIHRYLSSNWKELRNLEKDDPQLVDKARKRWFVPDPNKQQDVEARRDKALLREFDIYKAHKGKKMKEIRLEVMRVGFKAAWAAKDYRTIIDVSAKVPDEVWQEDERLMMLHSMAETRLEAER